MKFWDSSALVPLVLEELRSARCRALRRADKSVVVWMMTEIEMLSAIRRHLREGNLTIDGAASAEHRLATLKGTWREVEAADVVREHAQRLIKTHPLTSADALQLGAALVAVAGRPRNRALVVAAEALASAARAEGFSVIVPR